MTVPDDALTKIRRFCHDRTPPEFRDRMRLEATVRGNSVIIADCTAPWDDSKQDLTEFGTRLDAVIDRGFRRVLVMVSSLLIAGFLTTILAIVAAAILQ